MGAGDVTALGPARSLAALAATGPRVTPAEPRGRPARRRAAAARGRRARRVRAARSLVAGGAAVLALVAGGSAGAVLGASASPALLGVRHGHRWSPGTPRCSRADQVRAAAARRRHRAAAGPGRHRAPWPRRVGALRRVERGRGSAGPGRARCVIAVAERHGGRGWSRRDGAAPAGRRRTAWCSSGWPAARSLPLLHGRPAGRRGQRRRPRAALAAGRPRCRPGRLAPRSRSRSTAPTAGARSRWSCTRPRAHGDVWGDADGVENAKASRARHVSLLVARRRADAAIDVAARTVGGRPSRSTGIAAGHAVGPVVGTQSVRRRLHTLSRSERESVDSP